MKWFFREKKQPTTSNSGVELAITTDTEQESAAHTESSSSISRRSRRGIMRTAGLGVAAATGAAVLFQDEIKTAEAASAGNFSSTVSSTPAVKAAGTHGAKGVQASSDSSYGVYGTSTSSHGVKGSSSSNSGVFGTSSQNIGVQGTSTAPVSSSGTVSIGVQGTGNDIGVEGISQASAGIGIYGSSLNSSGVYGLSASKTGVYGASNAPASSNTSVGVQGFGLNTGVEGDSLGGTGVVGFSQLGYGGYFASGINNFPSQYALYADGLGSFTTGIYATGLAGAAHFDGNVTVNGSISKGGGSFLIDHPLDPANKSLYHSFVESPDMKNIYDGVVTLDINGEAIVTLPDWFGTLNTDFRHQLTGVGSAAVLYIAKEIENNQFTIAGGQAGMKVFWQVTGTRKDPWAEKNRIPVEVEKPANQRGRYHYPELYGQPGDKGINRPSTQPKRPTLPKA